MLDIWENIISQDRIESYAFELCSGLAIIYNYSDLTIEAGEELWLGDIGRYVKEVVTLNNPQVGEIITGNQVQYYINETTGEKIALAPAIVRDSVKSVVLASDTTEINRYAFEYCTNLQTVDFGTNSQLQTIGSYAFYCCTSLTTITILEQVTSIEGGAFISCSTLTTVVIDSAYAYTNAISINACGNLLRYARTVKVLTSLVEAGTNSYLTNTANFPYTWTEGDYTVYSRTAQRWLKKVKSWYIH